jgi:hypothetical protein
VMKMTKKLFERSKNDEKIDPHKTQKKTIKWSPARAAGTAEGRVARSVYDAIA